MPTYEYSCEKCGNFDVEQRITEAALEKCPTCQGEVHRVISATAFHLKGGGWYKTDYSGKSNSGSSNGSSASSAPTTSSSTTDTTSSSSPSSTPTKTDAASDKKGGCSGGGCGCH